MRPEFDFAPDLSAVEVDAGQISQVIHNLVINSKQAMAKGGIVRISAANKEVSAADNLPLKPGRYVVVSVRDHGNGIHPQHLPKIFDPYFTTKSSGTGLGLATAYSIVKRHDGLITVESEPGKELCSTFICRFPAGQRFKEKLILALGKRNRPHPGHG